MMVAAGDGDQPLVLVGHVEVAVHGVDGLLAVLGPVRPGGVGGEGRRRGDGGGELGLHVEPLTERARRGRS